MSSQENDDKKMSGAAMLLDSKTGRGGSFAVAMSKAVLALLLLRIRILFLGMFMYVRPGFLNLLYHRAHSPTLLQVVLLHSCQGTIVFYRNKKKFVRPQLPFHPGAVSLRSLLLLLFLNALWTASGKCLKQVKLFL